MAVATTWIVAIALLAGAVLFAAALRQRHRARGPWPVHPRKLLSGCRQELYLRLREALPDHFIFVEVQLTRLVRMKAGADPRRWFRRLRSAGRLSAGFVVCAPDGTVIAVIELGEASSLDPVRRSAQAAKRALLDSAGIPLLHWPLTGIPDVAAIRSAFGSLRGSRCAPATC